MRYLPTNQPNFVPLDIPADSDGYRVRVPLGVLDEDEFKQFAEAQAEALREHWEMRRAALRESDD